VDWIAGVPLALEPGERSAYSDANYALLARVIELVSGRSFGEFLRDEIIAPAGLAATGHRGDAATPVPGLAMGHVPVGLREIEPSSPVDYSASTGSGSIYSTASDLLRWHRALSGDEVLTPESRALMFRRHVDARGYGWILDERLGRSKVSMSG
jgi:CubicO group peptidase (beta-lactamase class C family)